MEDCENKKVIIRRGDYEKIRYVTIQPFVIDWTKVTKPIYQKQGNLFIGLKDYLHPGETIRVGVNKTLYRIIRDEKIVVPIGYFFRIVKLDDEEFSPNEIENSINAKVRITSRNNTIIEDVLFNKPKC